MSDGLDRRGFPSTKLTWDHGVLHHCPHRDGSARVEELGAVKCQAVTVVTFDEPEAAMRVELGDLPVPRH